jgi:hypothetical protein
MKKFIILLVALFTIISCAKDDSDDITVDQNSLEIFSGGTHQITTNQSNPVYSSEDAFVATVSETGLITAKHVGKTFIDVNGSRKITITVEAKYELYEPVHDFSLKKAEIRSKLGTPYSENDTLLLYRNPSSTINYEMYTFSKTTGQLSTATVIYPFKDYAVSNFALAERYQVYSSNSSNYVISYINKLNYSESSFVVLSHIYSISYCANLYYAKKN